MLPAVFALLPGCRHPQGLCRSHEVSHFPPDAILTSTMQWLFFRLRDLAFSDRTQPGASNCWIYAEPTSRPTAPAVAAFHLPLSSAHHPHPPASNTLPGRPGILPAVPAAGYQRCVLECTFSELEMEYCLHTHPQFPFVRLY